MMLNEIFSFRVEETGSNFPTYLRKVFLSQAEEIARRCVSKPLKKNPKALPFEPKPSLQAVFEFLVNDCIRRYPTEACPLCQQRTLPENPEVGTKFLLGENVSKSVIFRTDLRLF
jgi:hypothetical protein